MKKHEHDHSHIGSFSLENIGEEGIRRLKLKTQERTDAEKVKVCEAIVGGQGGGIPGEGGRCTGRLGRGT